MYFTPEEKKSIKECDNCYMLGVLAEGYPYYSTIGETQESITPMKDSSTIIFYIKPLSTDPQLIVEKIDIGLQNPFYIGRDNEQPISIIPPEYKYDTNLTRKVSTLRNKLNGKLLLFNPKMTFNNENKVYKNVSLVSIEDDIKVNTDTEFVPVPIVNLDNGDFEKQLQEGSNIILDDYNHGMYPPEYIICNKYIYTNFQQWKKHSSNTNIWICENYVEKVVRIPISLNKEENGSQIIDASSNLCFIDKKFLYKLTSDESLKQKISTISYQEESTLKQEENKKEFKIKELKFLEGMKNYTLQKNLYYAESDIYNLHVCIKTNPLTILAGMSGTGKSELANYYAEMLECSVGKSNLLFLPINPSFTEPGDLLGYLNNATGLYIPSETQLVDFLLHANEKEHKDTMHLVIFDEMNLSQVEYWFAPFISLLERPSDERRLVLYNKDSHCVNKQSYPSSVLIGSNIRFIGTVNIDETTKDFSDRLLDRANVITLKKESLRTLHLKSVTDKDTEFKYKEYCCSKASEYNEWIIDADKWMNVFTDEEREFLDNLHDIIQIYDKQKGVSFRIAKKIAEYISNIPKDEQGEMIISRRDAFDLQIKQRVITKLKGMEKQYGKLIGVIDDIGSNELSNGELISFLNEESSQKISDFTLTRKEIIRKAKELGVYGYAN